jgi:alkyl sulfatase
LIVAALAFTMTGCGSSTAISVSELTAESKPATQYTIDANQEVYALLDFEDTAEFENATKGLLASPDTANPSLWRDAQDADADVTWTTKRAGLLSIVQKNAENVAALIEQEGDETCLTRLMDAVTVTSEYKYFNIIEP